MGPPRRWNLQRGWGNMEVPETSREPRVQQKSLRKFVENVVDSELSDRLMPLLATAAKNGTVLDFQDILKRFTFDNICKIPFGYDPECLLLSLLNAKFVVAFEEAVKIGFERQVFPIHPIIWKTLKFLDIGSEKKFRVVIKEIKDFGIKFIGEKKHKLKEQLTLESADLLSRFLSSGIDDENFVLDIVISFILTGRDTTSVVLTWFFWLLSKHPEVEKEILNEVNEKSDGNLAGYDEVKDMIYTHIWLVGFRSGLRRGRIHWPRWWDIGTWLIRSYQIYF